ncbi:MAG: putative replicase protein [Alehxovirus frumentivicinum]|uniref:RNA-directed RNA polymerase n=1 Tax=Leviviridae sp. TaxID=2027243 RepID=A0ABY3SUX3_9VIRU|nr:MAG: putative replicase protein [Leviviridae sp.]
MKSYVSYLQGLYTELLSEASEYFPTLRRDCERDASRLLSLVDTRGLSYLMIDLPAMGKHFDRCLSMERLTLSGIPGQRGYRKGSPIPRLFKGMVLRVFDDFGMLRAVPDVDAIRFLRQFYYAAKKLKVACSDSRTWEHVHEFFETDQGARLPSLNWDEDVLGVDRLRDLHIGDPCDNQPHPLFPHLHERDEDPFSISDRLADAVQRTADIVSSTLGVFSAADWRTKHGPGAVADQRHTQFKYDFPSWPAKLSNVFPMSLYGFSSYNSWVEFVRRGEDPSRFSLNEPPSRLIAVPKTLKGPRLIASEPVSHQWCQQSIKDYLTTRLAFTPIAQSIHFRDQTENQEFARRASHTQSHVTVDLSSASDRLSCWLVERIFRRLPSLVEALHASRTRWVVNTIDRKSPRYHRLRKFACMGSACTFPVQSYVFSVLAHAAILHSRGLAVTITSLRRVSQEVRVFGDDIIIPADGWEVLQGLLRHLGLKVNHSKTYDSGKFRESCGLDAYAGHDVTPTYTMTYPDVTRPESIVSSVATHNNYVNRGWLRAAKYTESRLRRLRRIRLGYVPIGSGCFGLYDVECKGNGHLEKRWNTDLHRVEYRMDVASATTLRSEIEDEATLLQYFTEVQGPPVRPGERLGKAKRPTTSIRRRWVSLEAREGSPPRLLALG